MLYHVQPNSWSCLPTAFACLMDVPVDELIRRIGHDGSEIVFSDPAGRRGFHPFEIQQAIHSFGWLFTNYPFSMAIQRGPTTYTIPEPSSRVEDYLDATDMVLVVRTEEQHNHAVVWLHNEGRVYDPRGSKEPIENYLLVEGFDLWRLKNGLTISKLDWTS